jgi:uncharacterized repeat protein (TIGR03803 family)
MRHFWISLATFCVLAQLGYMPTRASATPTLTTLVTFDSTNGAEPAAGLIADANGNLYGTTSNGGPNLGQGLVFKLDAANNYALTVLASFNGSNGRNLLASVIADASGNFYGTTANGGANNDGTVFKLDASDNYAINTLATFNGTNGQDCYGYLLADAAGNLYETTRHGGSSNAGVVFKLDASNNYALTTLATFKSPNGLGSEAGLIADAAGNLYGTTGFGSPNFGGTVFKLTAANNYALSTLVAFEQNATPVANLIADAAGNLYGTTAQGGTNHLGAVFKLDASNNYALTTLTSFNGANGANPISTLIADTTGNLYGTTLSGGANSHGTVFELSGTGFVVVPEPATLAMLTLGSLLVLAGKFRLS